MAILWALVACLPRSRGDYSLTGLTDCRCTEWAGLDQHRVGSVPLGVDFARTSAEVTRSFIGFQALFHVFSRVVGILQG